METSMKAHDLTGGWFASFDEEEPGSLTLRNPDKGQRINLTAAERRRMQVIMEAETQASLEAAAAKLTPGKG
jgi:hypothetical protein